MKRKASDAGMVGKSPAPKRQNTAKSKGIQLGVVPFSAQNVTEWKNIDVTSSITGAAATTWSPVTLITTIAQGSSSAQRIGRKVVLKNAQVRYTATNGGGTATPFRILMVYDHSPNGVLPLITDILITNDINSPLNLNNSDRFLVLRDSYPRSEKSVDGTVSVSDLMFKKFKEGGLQSQWIASATGTIADVTTGAIYLMICGTAAVTLAFTSRVRFTDN